MRIEHKRCWFRVLTLLGLAVLWLAAGVRVAWLNWIWLYEYQSAQLEEVFFEHNPALKGKGGIRDFLYFGYPYFYRYEDVANVFFNETPEEDHYQHYLTQSLLPLIRSVNVDSPEVTDLSFLNNTSIRSLESWEINPKALQSLRGVALHKISIDGPIYEFPFEEEDSDNDIEDDEKDPAFLDCSFLKNMPLRALVLEGYLVKDLSPLQGMPLRQLQIETVVVTDLSPLKGMPLTHLTLEGDIQTSDLSPLQGMKLVSLNIEYGPFNNLSPLKDMPLKRLVLSYAKIPDLTPLTGMPLVELNLRGSPIRDLSPLAGMPLRNLRLPSTEVRNLDPLQGMQLIQLNLAFSRVQDLSPLAGMPLKELWITRTPAAKKPLPAWLVNSNCTIKR